MIAEAALNMLSDVQVLILKNRVSSKPVNRLLFHSICSRNGLILVLSFLIVDSLLLAVLLNQLQMDRLISNKPLRDRPHKSNLSMIR